MLMHDLFVVTNLLLTFGLEFLCLNQCKITKTFR